MHSIWTSTYQLFGRWNLQSRRRWSPPCWHEKGSEPQEWAEGTTSRTRSHRTGSWKRTRNRLLQSLSIPNSLEIIHTFINNSTSWWV